MRVPPSAEVWRNIPSWEFHRANVDPRRAQTVVSCARRAASLERLVSWPAAQAREALTSLPGVGEWTAAETAQRAFGDADAVSVGDYHIPKMIGWTLLGRPVDDAGMLELLEPMRPHRHRVVRVAGSQRTGLRAAPRRPAAGAANSLALTSSRCFRDWPSGTRRLRMTQFTIPGLTDKQAARLAELLQQQLSTYNDLHLTLKHIHWNVVGPNFIGVARNDRPQVDAVRGFADDVAERIAALGASPEGTPGAIVRDRTWDDYSVGRDTVPAHSGRTGPGLQRRDRRHPQGHRRDRRLDPVTQDMLIAQAGALEKFQWFVRAHLESAGGKLSPRGRDAPRRVRPNAARRKAK